MNKQCLFLLVLLLFKQIAIANPITGSMGLEQPSLSNSESVFRSATDSLPYNGGFEQWTQKDSLTYLPSNWFIIRDGGIPCSRSLNSGVRDSMRHNGKYAIKLETGVCDEDGGGLRYQMGFVSIGKFEYVFPIQTGMVYTKKPDTLSFWHKYSPVAGDTAWVECLLARVDEKRKLTDTVAFASYEIINQEVDYKQIKLPIKYINGGYPNAIHLEFSTSKNLSKSRQHRTYDPQYAHPGTTLWVDDVQLFGGDIVGIQEKQQTVLTVYPNPADNSVQLELSEASGIVQLYNLQGVLVATLPVATKNIELQLTALPSGLYLIRHQNKQGVATSRLSVLHP